MLAQMMGLLVFLIIGQGNGDMKKTVNKGTYAVADKIIKFVN